MEATTPTKTKTVALGAAFVGGVSLLAYYLKSSQQVLKTLMDLGEQH